MGGNMQGITIFKILPYNMVLEKIRSDAIARNLLLKTNKKKPSVERKATDNEIIEMRRLREVEHMRTREISKVFPQYTYQYINRIVNYYIANNVGIKNQLKNPCVAMTGNKHSHKVKELV